MISKSPSKTAKDFVTDQPTENQPMEQDPEPEPEIMTKLTSQTSNLRPEIVGGQSLTSMRSHFDADTKNIIVTTDRQLMYFSVESCQQVGQANIMPDKLSSDEKVIANDIFDQNIYLFTNHGKIFVWNLETKDWSNQLALPIEEIETLLSCRMLSKRQYIYTTRNSDLNTIQLWFSMSRSERERPKNREFISNCSLDGQTAFDIGCLHSQNTLDELSKTERDKMAKQRILTYVQDSHIFFQKVGVSEKFSQNAVQKRIPELNFTCVRANPRKPMVAAGNTLGQIILYSGDLSSVEMDRTKLHWHSLPVHDICFSSVGSRMYSVGGESGCVVVWDISTNNLGSKHIVARLGMPIRFINCSPRLNQLVLSFEDNEMQFMDTDNHTRELKTLTRRTIDLYRKNDPKALRNLDEESENLMDSSIGLLWSSKDDSVVTNGRTGWLQFYSPKDKIRLQSLNFLKTKILSLEKTAKVVPSEITKATLSLDGNWLALYETQVSGGSFSEVKLHIWQRSATSSKWVWIQTADRLHTSVVMTDLRFSPDGQYLISVSEDGSFHILHRICLDAKMTASGSSKKQMYAKGYVGNVPPSLASLATFSRDSSVMALSLVNDTTLIWMIVDPFKLVYECQLNSVATDEEVPADANEDALKIAESRHKVLGLHFGHHRPSEGVAPLCEVRTDSIRIWNILNSLEVTEFSSNELESGDGETQEFTSVAFDHCSQEHDYFAVSTKKNLILLFHHHLDQITDKLKPLFVFDAGVSMNLDNHYYTHMCFLANPVLEIDEQSHQDPKILKLINRLVLMNNHQELIGFTDKLTLERQSASNSCNAIKTFDMSDLQAYFAQSALNYREETTSMESGDKIDQVNITEKQKRIRKRLEVQKMLKDLLTRIPSQNLPKMEILGPMILDKLV